MPASWNNLDYLQHLDYFLIMIPFNSKLLIYNLEQSELYQ